MKRNGGILANRFMTKLVSDAPFDVFHVTREKRGGF